LVAKPNPVAIVHARHWIAKYQGVRTVDVAFISLSFNSAPSEGTLHLYVANVDKSISVKALDLVTSCMPRHFSRFVKSAFDASAVFTGFLAIVAIQVCLFSVNASAVTIRIGLDDWAEVNVWVSASSSRCSEVLVFERNWLRKVG
jgi:hypothetical protein